jgi:3-oxoacid CoA-transferase B subunit
MTGPTPDPRITIARRCALELRDGEVVNLGFGIPTLTVNYLPAGIDVIFHTENGCFGFGPKPGTREADSDMTSASNEPITTRPGAAIMDLATSLGAMRNGYIATSVLGGEGRWWPGIGGAMDLCHGVPRIIAALQHIDKRGDSKVKRRTRLPLTGRRCVKVIVTDKAVFDVGAEGLILREAFPGLDVPDIRAITEADFTVAADFKPMPV